MLHWLNIVRKSSLILLAFTLMMTASCTNDNTVSQEKAEPTTKKGDRLDLIKKRGNLICGINDQLLGFSYKEKDGSYSGLSVDLCRALAVALFNDPTKVEFRNLSAEERFKAVASGKVDILSRNTTWTLSRDTTEGLDFPPTNFYDSQGLLVSQDSDINNLEDLKGKYVCVARQTTSETNLATQMRKKDITYFAVTFEDTNELFATYESKSCDAATGDRSELVARRSNLANPDRHKILDETLSKEPLGPVIADGEPEWFDVVKWVSYAMIEAEELGISSQNIDRLSNTKNPAISRFLGKEENMAKNIQLSDDFAKRVVQQVGNYGEVYQRNIGEPFGLERGINALSQNGGLIYSPPFR